MLHTTMNMEQSFSFRYIKLGVGLALLLISSPLQSLGLITLGGIALMTAFASFGSHNYRGAASKLTYKIGRYVLAALLFAIAVIQIYVLIAMPDTVHYSAYYTIVDVALIAYLLMYKPSDTSVKMKILKVVGYTAILIGVNALQSSRITVKYMTYSTSEINWGTIFTSATVMMVGIILIIFSNYKLKIVSPKID